MCEDAIAISSHVFHSTCSSACTALHLECVMGAEGSGRQNDFGTSQVAGSGGPDRGSSARSASSGRSPTRRRGPALPRNSKSGYTSAYKTPGLNKFQRMQRFV